MKCNEMDSIIVVSNHSKNILSAARFEGTDEATGQPIRLENKAKITAVNYPVKEYSELPDLGLQFDTKFNFLTVAQMGPRKKFRNYDKMFY